LPPVEQHTSEANVHPDPERRVCAFQESPMALA
jgi:hypothetical protein